jgi:hypothetical protein
MKKLTETERKAIAVSIIKMLAGVPTDPEIQTKPLDTLTWYVELADSIYPKEKQNATV